MAILIAVKNQPFSSGDSDVESSPLLHDQESVAVTRDSVLIDDLSRESVLTACQETHSHSSNSKMGTVEVETTTGDDDIMELSKEALATDGRAYPYSIQANMNIFPPERDIGDENRSLDSQNDAVSEGESDQEDAPLSRAESEAFGPQECEFMHRIDLLEAISATICEAVPSAESNEQIVADDGHLTDENRSIASQDTTDTTSDGVSDQEDVAYSRTESEASDLEESVSASEVDLPMTVESTAGDVLSADESRATVLSHDRSIASQDGSSDGGLASEGQPLSRAESEAVELEEERMAASTSALLSKTITAALRDGAPTKTVTLAPDDASDNGRLAENEDAFFEGEGDQDILAVSRFESEASGFEESASTSEVGSLGDGVLTEGTFPGCLTINESAFFDGESGQMMVPLSCADSDVSELEEEPEATSTFALPEDFGATKRGLPTQTIHLMADDVSDGDCLIESEDAISDGESDQEGLPLSRAESMAFELEEHPEATSEGTMSEAGATMSDGADLSDEGCLIESQDGISTDESDLAELSLPAESDVAVLNEVAPSEEVMEGVNEDATTGASISDDTESSDEYCSIESHNEISAFEVEDALDSGAECEICESEEERVSVIGDLSEREHHTALVENNNSLMVHGRFGVLLSRSETLLQSSIASFHELEDVIFDHAAATADRESDATGAIVKLYSELHQAEGENDETAEELLRLQSENDALVCSIVSYDAILSSVSSHAGESKREIEDSHSVEISRLKSAIANMMEEKMQLEREHKEAMSEILTLKFSCAAADEEVVKSKIETERLASVEAEKGMLERTHEQALSEILTLKLSWEAAVEELVQYKTEKEHLATVRLEEESMALSEIQALKLLCASTAEELARANAEKDQFETMREAAEVLKRAHEEALSEVQALKLACASAAEQLVKAEAEKEQLASIKGDNEALERAYEEALSKIYAVELSCASTTEELLRANAEKEQLAKIRDENETLERAHEEVLSELQALKLLYASAADEVAQSKAEKELLASTRDEKEMLERSYEQILSEVQSLKLSGAAMAKELVEARTEKEQLANTTQVEMEKLQRAYEEALSSIEESKLSHASAAEDVIQKERLLNETQKVELERAHVKALSAIQALEISCANADKVVAEAKAEKERLESAHEAALVDLRISAALRDETAQAVVVHLESSLAELKAEKERLSTAHEEAVMALRFSLHHHETSLDDLKAEKVRLESAHEEVLIDLRINSDQLQTSLADLMAEKERLESLHEEAMIALRISLARREEEAEAATAKLAARLEEFEAQKRDLEGTIEYLQSDNRDLAQENARQKTSLEDLEILHEQMRDEFNQKVMQTEQLQTTVATLEAQVATLSSSARANEAKKELQESLSTEIATLRAENVALGVEVKKLRSTNSEIESSIALSQSEMEQQKTALETVLADLQISKALREEAAQAAAAQQATALAQLHAQQEEAAQAAEAQMTASSAKLEAMKGEYESIIDKLRSSIREKEQENAAIECNLGELEQTIEQLRNEVLELDEKAKLVDEVERYNEELQDSVSVLEDQVASLTLSLHDSESKREHEETLRAELELLKTACTDKEEEISLMRSDKERLEKARKVALIDLQTVTAMRDAATKDAKIQVAAALAQIEALRDQTAKAAAARLEAHSAEVYGLKRTIEELRSGNGRAEPEGTWIQHKMETLSASVVADIKKTLSEFQGNDALRPKALVDQEVLSTVFPSVAKEMEGKCVDFEGVGRFVEGKIKSGQQKMEAQELLIRTEGGERDSLEVWIQSGKAKASMAEISKIKLEHAIP
ncbi:hypothetical protein HK101_010965 [Irineochytrium annulatum]|nr:hypothetical protein HK101_010965 [Irineochytrium annulatum]